MEIINSQNIFQKQIKNFKSYSNLKILSLAAINIIAILYFIDIIKINFNKNNNSVRILEESDPRSQRANEKCVEFSPNRAFDLFKLDEEKINVGIGIELKFCSNIHNNRSSCIYINNNRVIRLSGDIGGEENSKNAIDVFDSENESERKVKIYLASGDKCLIDEKKKYKIDIELYCNNQTKFEILTDKTEFDPESTCNLKLFANSKFACGEDFLEYFPTFFRIIGGIILVILGLLIGILGYNQIRIAIFLVCTIGSLILSDYICTMFGIIKLAINIVISIIFLLVGIGLFVFFIKKKEYIKYFMFIVGGVCGYPVGNIIYTKFFSLIDTSKQTLMKVIIIAFFIILGVILGMFLPKYTYIIGTSILGATLITYGINLFLYKVISSIDQRQLTKLAQTGNFEKIKEMVWNLSLIYPIITIVLTIILIIIQIKINPNWKDVDNYKDLDEKFNEKPKDLPDFKLMKDSEYSENPETEKNKES